MISWDNYNLPEFRLGKRRSQGSPYSTTEAFAGPLYIEQITDDVPVSWDVTITCVGIQRTVFQVFLSDVRFSGEFVKSIKVESGVVDHVVRIISGVPQPAEISAGVWEYSFAIYATALDISAPLPDQDILCGEALAQCGESSAQCGE